MAEWLKAHAWKACIRATVSWVRIPLPPPAVPAASPWQHSRNRPQSLVNPALLAFQRCDGNFTRTTPNGGRCRTLRRTRGTARPARRRVGASSGGKAGRRVGKLTARYVETAKTPGLFGDGGNLFLKVDDGGSKSWIFRHQVNGKARKYGLGPTHTVSLSDARERAEAIRRQLLDGIDPGTRRAEQARRRSRQPSRSRFDDARDLIASHQRGWQQRQAPANGTRRCRPTPASIRQVAGSAIDTGLVMRVLQPIWVHQARDGYPPARPHRKHSVAGPRCAAIAAGENPAQWRGHLDHLLPARGKVRKVVHHAALPYAELPAFVATCASTTASPRWRWNSPS